MSKYQNIYCAKCGVHVIKLYRGTGESFIKPGTKCFCSACSPVEHHLWDRVTKPFGNWFNPEYSLAN